MAFKFNFDFVKKRPLLVGGIVIVGGLLLYFAMNRGSSSGDSGGAIVVSGQTDPAQAQQYMQNQALAYQANAQTSQQNFQLKALEMQTQGQLALAEMSLQLEEGRDIRMNNTAVTLANFQAQVANNQTAAQQAIGLAGIDAQKQVGLASVAVQQTLAYGQYELNSADAYYRRVEADNYVFTKTLDTQTAWKQIEYAAITASNVAQHQAQAQIGVAQQQKKAAQSNMWGNIVGGALSAFL